MPKAVHPGVTRLAARGLGVRVGGTDLLRDVDLQIRAGEVVAVVGPNGAGKSTLLAALAGDRIPGAHLRGEVELDGRPLRSWSEGAQAMRRAVLTQDHAVGLAFTGADVVRMGRAPWWDVSDDDTDAAVVDAAMRRTAVSAFARRDVTRISGGERSRVGMARCLAQEAGVLLLDEPTAALDLRHQVTCLQLAAELAHGGTAVVAVLHDLALAARFADRIVLLADGRIRADGPPAAVLDAPLLSEVYGCDVDVLTHPRDGSLLVLPGRSAVRPEPRRAPDPARSLPGGPRVPV